MGVGIVCFSFGLRAEPEEPNPSNWALAEAATNAYASYQGKGPIAMVSQWEVNKALVRMRAPFAVDRSVELNVDGSYLDSKGVWEEAKAVFEQKSVTEVVIIAQPFLHLTSLKQMVKSDGYGVLNFKIPPILFDDSAKNTQPWTRSKLRLLIYAVRLKLGLSHGHDGRQQVV